MNLNILDINKASGVLINLSDCHENRYKSRKYGPFWQGINFVIDKK